MPDGAKFCQECGVNVLFVSGQSGIEQDGGAAASDEGQSILMHSMMSQAQDEPGAEGGGMVIDERYEVQKKIGQGGFAEVYLCLDQKLNRPVAIKRLLSELLTGPEGEQTLQRFQQEAQSVATLTHRNIVHVHDQGSDDRGHYIVMEYVDGGSLQDYLKEKGKLTPEEAIEMVRGIGSGLAYAHRRKLVHRDIKPANILLLREGDELIPKIVDFGLARAGVSSGMSMSGYGMGTMHYMPPEQSRDAKGVDHTADIYALGKVFYELLTGQLPDALDPSEIPPPPGLSEVIFRCTKPKPEDRYFSVDYMFSALDKLDGQLEPEKAAVRPPERKKEPRPGEENTVELPGGVELILCWCPATTSTAWKEISGGDDFFLMGLPEGVLGLFICSKCYKKKISLSNLILQYHTVQLTKGFWMGKYPLTKQQWEAVAGRDPSVSKESGPYAPVEEVSWDDIHEWLVEANRDFSGRGLRLPTEAEWEYACRAGTNTLLNSGENITTDVGPCPQLDRLGWYKENSGYKTHPVGELMPNTWGIYDMHGNVWEWCQDWFDFYSQGLATDPTGPVGGDDRVIRGGGWGDNPWECQSTFRRPETPSYRSPLLGFRVVMDFQ